MTSYEDFGGTVTFVKRRSRYFRSSQQPMTGDGDIARNMTTHTANIHVTIIPMLQISALQAIAKNAGSRRRAGSQSLRMDHRGIKRLASSLESEG